MNQNLTQQKSPLIIPLRNEYYCHRNLNSWLLLSRFKLKGKKIAYGHDQDDHHSADHWYCGAAPLHKSPLQQYSLQFQNHI